MPAFTSSADYLALYSFDGLPMMQSARSTAPQSAGTIIATNSDRKIDPAFLPPFDVESKMPSVVARYTLTAGMWVAVTNGVNGFGVYPASVAPEDTLPYFATASRYHASGYVLENYNIGDDAIVYLSGINHIAKITWAGFTPTPDSAVGKTVRLRFEGAGFPGIAGSTAPTRYVQDIGTLIKAQRVTPTEGDPYYEYSVVFNPRMPLVFQG